MGLTDKDFIALQPGVNQLNSERSDADRQLQEAALKKYLQAQEPEIAGKSQSAKNAANLDTLSNPRLRAFLQPGGMASVGDIKVGQEPKVSIALTPAQESAEKEAGKKIAEFEGGGKQANESNVGQIQSVAEDLQGGKRDMWDKNVGGALENHPTLMAMFAPKEKSRRDSVQNAMLSMLHDAGIPRPTQWDIQRVFGQVYDPASDDKTNLVRLKQAVDKMKAHQSAVQSQADQYHKSGYATIGGPKQPGLGGQQPSTQASPAAAPSPQVLRVKHKASGQTGTLPANEFDPNIYEQVQ